MKHGEVIGRGRTADVYSYGGDKVLKLSHPGFAGSVERESENTKAAVLAGTPAPRFHGTVEIEDQFGAVYDRARGVPMLEILQSGRPRTLEMARILGTAHARILAATSEGPPKLHDRLQAAYESDAVPADVASAAIRALDDLPTGTSLLHGDMHPGNVIVGDGGATVIDWVDASIGPPAADVARSLWLMNPSTIPVGTGIAARSLRLMVMLFRRRYRSVVQRAADLSHREVTSWRLPVLAARLSEEIESEREHLMAEIRRAMVPR